VNLQSGNQKQILIHETDCTIEVDGKKFTGSGAFVDQQIAVVYIGIKNPSLKGLPAAVDREHTWNIPIIVKDWHGSKLGEGFITGIWRQSNYRENYKMASVVFQIEGLWYKGRFAPDHGDLCRGTRLRTKKVIAELTSRLQATYKTTSTKETTA
jgi:hypothetical protein